MKKKILIAVDGSPNCNLSLEYIGDLFKKDESIDCVLLYCEPTGPEIIPEPEDSRNSLLPDTTFSKAHIKGQRVLHNAYNKLKQTGISENRLQTDSITSSGVAAAIQQYAEQNLLDSIVVARRGVGLVGELLLGSVSSSLFDRSRGIPLWILDGKVSNKDILIPVDGSPSSLMAIDHLAYIFENRTDIQFNLFHTRGLFSSPPVCKPAQFYDKWGKDWCDTNLSGDGCLYKGPSEILLEAGIPSKSITTLPQPTSLEESTAIINAAKQNKCGTIVIGRRPENEPKGLLGGVSKRTVRQTQDLALWVIG